jgi:putative tributyrin esterase
MIHCKCYFYSNSLKYNTDINVLIPDKLRGVDGDNCRDHTFPLLVLLHGGAGDCNSWMRNTNIERFAEQYNLAVVMPSGHNSFFCDAEYGESFFSYVSDELIPFVQSLFPVSNKREHTFIAGASMGGYGSALLALSRPDLVSAFGVFSGAIDPLRIDIRLREIGITNMRYDLLFGGSDKVAGSRFDLFKKVKEFPSEAEKSIASIYIGEDDVINYDMSLELHDALREHGFDSRFLTAEGGHDWKYWEYCVADFLQELHARKLIGG